MGVLPIEPLLTQALSHSLFHSLAVKVHRHNVRDRAPLISIFRFCTTQVLCAGAIKSYVPRQEKPPSADASGGDDKTDQKTISFSITL